MPNGQLVETSGFGAGLAYPEYVGLMRKSKVIPCPGGALTPDTFRLYEALELGCIPIADMHGGLQFEGDYWHKIFGYIPFPTIESWDDFPKILENTLDNYDVKQQNTLNWWHSIKAKIVLDLFNQINEIS